MVLAETGTDVKMIVVNCDCGCNEEIHIVKYENGVGLPNDYYITIMESKFYSLQGGIWSKFKHRIKMIWRAITGKEYRLCEICITDEDIDELIKDLKIIRKN